LPARHDAHGRFIELLLADREWIGGGRGPARVDGLVTSSRGQDDQRQAENAPMRQALSDWKICVE